MANASSSPPMTYFVPSVRLPGDLGVRLDAQIARAAGEGYPVQKSDLVRRLLEEALTAREKRAARRSK